MHHFPHSTYYQDRQTEYQLCQDFPGDDVLIDGLHAMQLHFQNNNVSLEIPVVRIMNTAHFLAAYMFSTDCSGDQLEYDAIAHDSLSRDRQLTRVAMIVLAAMLKRTQGFRASNCRNLILENREPDFDYGVTLYDRFLRSAEKRFSEESFLIDTHAQILALKSENEQLAAENTELKIKYHIMENQQNIQYKQDNNQGTIYNAPVYITYTTPAPDAQPSKAPQKAETQDAKPLPFLVPDKLAELGTYTIEEFEALYHEAVKAGAPKLAKFLKHYRDLEVLDVKGFNKKQTFEELKAYFGDEIDYGYPNFAAYY